MATLSPPTYAQNFITNGDIDVFNGISSDQGDGTIYVRNGGLLVSGLTDLNHTTIVTNSGQFTVEGSNLISMGVSAAIQLTAADTSYFTTSSNGLTLSATNATTGTLTLTSAGDGPNSILINSTNTTDGQITISCASASTSTSAIQLLATNTTDGDILLQAAGNFASSNPAIYLNATNTTSGQIKLLSAGNSGTSDAIHLESVGTTGGNIVLKGAAAGATIPAINIQATSTTGQSIFQSAGDSSSIDAIQILATGTTNGNVLIKGAGGNGGHPSIKLLANNSTSGQIYIEGDGNISNAVKIIATNATNGGITIDATGGPLTINTQNTSSGITIGTATTGVPVTIGTSSSVTTVKGDFIVQGTTTSLNTETLTVEDNVILLNSGNGETGLDSGLIVRRFQSPNNAGTGDVITSTPTPIQEQGTFQTGSATPDTLVLAAFASTTDNFYNGWWIKITSGSGINQVRRIKSYVASTNTATIYLTSDNTTNPPPDSAPFTDGLDLVTAPASGDSYQLYSAPFIASVFKEADHAWEHGSLTLTPGPNNTAGTHTVAVQQYQTTNMGTINSIPQVYNNVFGSASTTTITFTINSHGISSGDKIEVSNSLNFTPSIPAQLYVVQSTPTANTFTITVAASTTSASNSSATIKLLKTSALYANVIAPYNNDYGGITIGGITNTMDIFIPKTSTSNFTVSISNTYGVYLMLVGDVNNTNGAFSVFSLASSGSGGSFSTLAQSKGSSNQRINTTWASSNQIQIYQSPAASSGSGTFQYRVRLYLLY